MRIGPVFKNSCYNKRTQNFCGTKDKNQPLTPVLKDIFTDSEISKSRKKVLWRLSEIENFCEASKDTPRGDLLELSDKIINSDTNILEMALNGDIKIFSLKGNEFSIKELLSLARIVKQKKGNPKEKGQSLLDIIKSLPIFQIEDIATKLYKEDNIYPRNLIIKRNGDPESVGESGGSNALQKAINIYLAKLFENESLESGDSIILFDENIKGRNDYIFTKQHIPSDLLEDEIVITPPNLIPLFKKEDTKKAMYSLSGTPYFYNLVKNTPIENIETLAKIENITDGAISGMLKGDITLDIINPSGRGEIKRPLINPKEIMLNKKLGIYQTDDFIKILEQETPVSVIFVIINTFKNSGADKIHSILFSRMNNEFITKVNWEKDSKKGHTYLKFDADNPLLKNIKKVVDKAPFQKGIVIFEKTE